MVAHFTIRISTQNNRLSRQFEFLLIFAVMVGVGASTVAQWEQGNKKPSGASARLLDVIDRKGIEAIAWSATQARDWLGSGLIDHNQ